MYPTNQVLCTVCAWQCHWVIQFLFSSRHSRTCYPTQASKIFLLWLGCLKSFGLWWLQTNWKLKRDKKHLTNNHLLHCCDFSLFLPVQWHQPQRTVSTCWAEKDALSIWDEKLSCIICVTSQGVLWKISRLKSKSIIQGKDDWTRGLLAKLLNWAIRLHCKGRLRWKTCFTRLSLLSCARCCNK